MTPFIGYLTINLSKITLKRIKGHPSVPLKDD